MENLTFTFPRAWAPFIKHVFHVEPLSVGAFVGALDHDQHSASSYHQGWVLDIGMNLGFYSVVAASLAPHLKLLSVDMQPKCAELTQCALQLTGLLPSENITLLNRYVTTKGSDAINVPEQACDTMASPTAVAGRRPDGRLRGTMRRLNQTVLVPVNPINLGRYLMQRMHVRERVVAVKIDTEGFEAKVLESLRPAWHKLEDIIFELQPTAWKHHGVDVDVGIATFREFMIPNNYRVMSLPRYMGGSGQGKLVVEGHHVDPCKLPKRNFTRTPKWQLGSQVPVHGMTRAVVFDFEGLEDIIRKAVAKNNHFFYEFMLTKKVCQ